jgi:endonuclease III
VLEFNKDKVINIIELINNDYISKKKLYKVCHHFLDVAPQHKYIPEKIVQGSEEHIIFLYFAVLMTYHSQSEEGFKSAVKLYMNFPELFNLDLKYISINKIIGCIKSVGFIYPNQLALSWKESGITVFELYDNPVKLVKKFKNVDDFLEEKNKLKIKYKMNKFRGYGPKLYSLFTLFCEELGIINHVEGAFPVDVHIQRQFLSWELVKNNNDKIDATNLAEFIRKNLSVLCYSKKIKPLHLFHALWFLGNRLCRICYRLSIQELESYCPTFKFCNGSVSTKMYRRKGIWDLSISRNNKGNLKNILPGIVNYYKVSEFLR